MARLPRLTAKEVIAALQRNGFEMGRVKDSHHLLRHSDGRVTVVPVHAGEKFLELLQSVRCGQASAGPDHRLKPPAGVGPVLGSRPPSPAAA
jgi:predicted RNA binding protein YcfA (HicA-like mRNA interferase family)